ncbi:MAG: hypothetical protein FJY16_03065 [Bacteroidetes bacterium]|nr:hypothetical protein [Bacteroidota bacterium]
MIKLTGIPYDINSSCLKGPTPALPRIRLMDSGGSANSCCAAGTEIINGKNYTDIADAAFPNSNPDEVYKKVKTKKGLLLKKLILILFIYLATNISLSAQQLCVATGNYPAPELSQPVRAKMQADLNLAASQLKENPAGLNELIWAGRRTAYLGNYTEAIDYYTTAIALHAESPEPYRHRGHRWITIRCFDKAITDLSAAAKLIKGKQDVVEIDGMPNEKNIPTSTLHTNIWYHLGLAYYYKGEFINSSEAFKSCLAASTNSDMFIAAANWYNISLRKAGDTAAANLFLRSVNPNLSLIENFDYLRILKLYIENQEIGNPMAFLKNEAGLGAASYGYGLGVYLQLKGENEKANLVFNHILTLKQWGAFGYIGAERER